MEVDQFITRAERLENFAECVHLRAKDLVSQASDALFENRPLPDGCTSKKSMALLILGCVGEKLDELNGAYKELDEFIRSQ